MFRVHGNVIRVLTVLPSVDGHCTGALCRMLATWCSEANDNR